MYLCQYQKMLLASPHAILPVGCIRPHRQTGQIILTFDECLMFAQIIIFVDYLVSDSFSTFVFSVISSSIFQ